MDKRTLFFFVSLTLTLFVVNLFFQYQNQGTNKKWVEQQKALQQQHQEKLLVELSERTSKPNELPLVELFSDSQGNSYVTTGVKVDDAILVLSWSGALPKTLYSREWGSRKTPQALSLRTEAPRSGEPAIYSRSATGTLRIADLEDVGTFDLQLMSAAPRLSSEEVRISLGRLRDGNFSLPAEDLEITVDEQAAFLPGRDAIILRKTSQGYLPAAVYSLEHSTLFRLEDFEGLGAVEVVSEVPEIPMGTGIADQKYYVLENAFVQLVFTNVGGALSEINLPFETEENPKSVVKEIELDREMMEKHPADAHFPAHGYYTTGTAHDGTSTFHAKGHESGYYPLLRRDVIAANGSTETAINPHFYSTNIVSEYPEMAQRPYTVKRFTKNQIVFESQQSRRRITKTYTLSDAAPYVVDLTIDVDGDAKGLWLTSGVPEVELVSGYPAPAIKYRFTRFDKSEVTSVDLPKDTIAFSSFHPDWITNSNGFFGLIVDPLSEIDPGYKATRVSSRSAPTRLMQLSAGQDSHGAPKEFPGYQLLLPLKGSGGSMQFRLFTGPFASDILERADEAFSDPATGYNPEYTSAQSYHGWASFISEPFSKFLFALMRFFHHLTGSWAFSIILLTIALRLMLYPLNAWSTKSALRMQKLGPKVAALNEKYKKDPKKAQMETFNLYREEGVNPMSGCFPLIIQMPFLIGMYDLLKSTFELRGATFIPGWIDDLAAPDVLFTWGQPIPFIGNEFHLLPLILGACMFLQQRMMSPAPSDPNLMTDQQRQARAMTTMMAPMFTIMFYHFPSGLSIYWISSTVVGVLQQWITARQLNKESSEKASDSGSGSTPSKQGKPKKRKA